MQKHTRKKMVAGISTR